MVVETKNRPMGRWRGRRLAVLAGMLLTLAAVAGCASGGTSAVGGAPAKMAPPAALPSTSQPAAPATTPPQSPAASAPPAAGSKPATSPAPKGPGIAPGEPAPVPGGPQTISYRADGNRLTVWFSAGICEKYGLKADESRAGQVGVRIVVTTPIPPGQVCAAVAEKQSATVDLAKPLAGRTVLDTAGGTEVPLETAPSGR
ncbi:hypothetical protein [Kitasatospora sp. NPDC057223]|uniref:hypothetical protein n=1 Tax=Kitasatospora sp. NPDC057223 TaxID=3346055 RepID=UPI003630C680